MRNMYLEQKELQKIFNKEIIENLNNVVLKEPLWISLYYGDLNSSISKNSVTKTNLYNLLLSFIYNVQKIIDDIENLESIYYEKDLIFLFNCVHKINEGIKIIKDKFEWINFDYENDGLFYDNLSVFWKNIVNNHHGSWIPEMDELLKNDDINFEYYRALLFHPLSTNRHPKCPPGFKNNYFKNYRYLQNVQDFFINDNLQKRFIGNDQAKKNKYPVSIRIYLIDIKEHDINENAINRDNNNSYFLNLDLDEVIKYLKKKYESINSAIKSLEDKNNELINNIKYKFDLDEDNYQFLKRIINVLNIEKLYFKDFEDLLEQYNLFLNKSLLNDNYEILNDYFKDVFGTIRANIKYLENPIYYKEYDLFNFVYLLSSNKDIHDTFKYSLEKIYTYLLGERNGSMPINNDHATDVEWGLNEALNFYENFAKQYVKMDIFNKNLTFLEIKLLFRAAIWKYNNEKC